MKLPYLARIFFGVMYLLGCLVHLRAGLFAPQDYPAMAPYALIPLYSDLFTNLPNPAVFGLSIAVFELVLGLLILNRGIFVKVGLGVSIIFQILLVPLGFWGILNVVLAVGQALLLHREFNDTVIDPGLFFERAAQ